MRPGYVAKRLVGLARFARNARGFLDEQLTVDQIRQEIAEGVRTREQRFLNKLTAFYQRPHSPHFRLLAAAGCEQGDIRRLVETDGLESTLTQLAKAGVYLAYEEFKGRMPAKRGSQTFHFGAGDFEDPNLEPELFGSSGGTRGKPTQSAGSLAYMRQMVPHWGIFLIENDCLDIPLTFWTPGHAGATSRYLCCAKFGQKCTHWFVSEEMSAAKDRFYARCRQYVVRRETGLVRPISASYDEPGVVLDTMLPMLADGRATMNTAPSAAVKMSLAAQQRGRSLAGLTFLLGAEPLTPERKAAIEASGARATPLYGASEATWIGGQCRNAEHADEVHALRDNYGLIRNPHSPTDANGADSILLTSLQPLNQKVLLNTDIGDRAVMRERACDCEYHRLGCTTILHTIRSSDKITEYGVNFAVADVFRVLEDKLPGKLGGVAGDYQLVEWRDSDGLPRYTLNVHPRLPERPAEQIADAFYTALSPMQSYYGYMVQIFRKERVLQVERAEPIRTGRSKLFPFLRRA